MSQTETLTPQAELQQPASLQIQPASHQIEEVRQQLASAKPIQALTHLHAAIEELQTLARNLHAGPRPDPAVQRNMEKQLLALRQELRQANRLTEQGLSFCKEWAEIFNPESYGVVHPDAYGVSAQAYNASSDVSPAAPSPAAQPGTQSYAPTQTALEADHG